MHVIHLSQDTVELRNLDQLGQDAIQIFNFPGFWKYILYKLL